MALSERHLITSFFQNVQIILIELRMVFIDNRTTSVLENHTEGLTGPTYTIEEGLRGRNRKREDPVVTS